MAEISSLAVMTDLNNLYGMSPSNIKRLLEDMMNMITANGGEIYSVASVCEGGCKDILVAHRPSTAIGKPKWNVFTLVADIESMQGVHPEVTAMKLAMTVSTIEGPVHMVTLSSPPNADAKAHGKTNDGLRNILICHQVFPKTGY